MDLVYQEARPASNHPVCVWTCFSCLSLLLLEPDWMGPVSVSCPVIIGPLSLACSSLTRLDKQPSPSGSHSRRPFLPPAPQDASPLIWAAFRGPWLGTYVNSSLVHLKEKRLPEVLFLVGKLCFQNKLLPQVCQFTEQINMDVYVRLGNYGQILGRK